MDIIESKIYERALSSGRESLTSPTSRRETDITHKSLGRAVEIQGPAF